MGNEIDLLENRLLSLGRAELDLEKSIRDLLATTRGAAAAGEFKASDEAWSLYQEAKATLAALKQQIAAVEVRLYARRRRTSK